MILVEHLNELKELMVLYEFVEDNLALLDTLKNVSVLMLDPVVLHMDHRAIRHFNIFLQNC